MSSQQKRGQSKDPRRHVDDRSSGPGDSQDTEGGRRSSSDLHPQRGQPRYVPEAVDPGRLLSVAEEQYGRNYRALAQGAHTRSTQGAYNRTAPASYGPIAPTGYSESAPASYNSSASATYNPSALFPRQGRDSERHGPDAQRPPGDAPGPDADSVSTSTFDLREQFIKKTPSDKFTDWCRFIDRYPELLKNKNDATIYVNEAIKARENKSESRAKLCIEKAVFLTIIGGKKQRDRDEFFDRFHEREKTTMEIFVQRYKTIDERCRAKKSSAPLPSQSTTSPDDEERVRHTQGALDSLSINPRSSRPAIDDDDEHPETRPVRAEPGRHQGLPSQGHNRSSGPPIDTRDPANTGLEPSIKGIPDKFEKLDPKYERRNPRRAGSFFKEGRVFAILEHVEDGRRFDDSSVDAKWKTRKGDIVILSHIRRFAVVREGHGYCWAVPINTYNGHGLLKSGFNDKDIRAHAIIYDSEDKPKMLKGEPMLSKTPIAVDRSEEADPLTYASRINFAKVTTVEHNVRAMAVGRVSRSSHANFVAYWREHLLDSSGPR